MGSMLGSIVDAVLVHGLLAIERLYPMPARLGSQLPLGRARGANADPIVLVGGFANSMSGWDEWKRSLEADGFQVFVFDPPSVGLGDMHDSARAAAAFIEEVRRRTGRRVDVIGFSEGGLLARMAVAHYGALGAVDRLLSLATPHHGVAARPVHDLLAGVRLLRSAIPESATQLLAGSELIAQLDAADASLRAGRGARAPRYGSVFSMSHDLFVTPWASRLDGAVNVPVRERAGRPGGPNHFELLHSSDPAYEAMRLLLLDAPPQAAVAAGLLAR